MVGEIRNMQVYNPADSITGRHHGLCRAVYKNNQGFYKENRSFMYKTLYAKLMAVKYTY